MILIMNAHRYKLLSLCLLGIMLSCSNNSINSNLAGQDQSPVSLSPLAMDAFIDIEPIIASEGVQHCNAPMQSLYKNPSEIAGFLDDIASKILKGKTGPAEALQIGFRLQGMPAGGIGPPLSGTHSLITPVESNEDLKAHLSRLSEKGIIGMDKPNQSAFVSCGYEFQKAIIELILLLEKSNSLLEAYRQPLTEKLNNSGNITTHELLAYLLGPFSKKQLMDFASLELLERANMRQLSYASRLIMDGLHSVSTQFMKIEVPADFRKLTILSKYGRIGIFGIENDTITESYAILINLGGNDYYSGSFASSGIDHPLGILLDFEGDDSYISSEGEILASGLLGGGILIDYSGNDQYITNSPGLGSGIYGFGLLVDYHGDDNYYSSGHYSQGAAIAGTGLLFDAAGDDQYQCSHYSQAFGGTLGTGLLMDFEGNDVYRGVRNNEQDIHFVQGSAKGRWASATDGYSLGGGCGILIDGRGADSYSAGSFSQGAGYYFGAGFLYDAEGDDVYDAVSHSQAYGVHYSMGCMLEVQGNDHYNSETDSTKISQIIASGRDHSIGIFMELSGDDEYFYGNRSLAISDMEGIGICLDYAGTDKFHHYHNELNKTSPSGGKIIGITGPMVNFRIFPVQTKSMALFQDLGAEH